MENQPKSINLGVPSRKKIFSGAVSLENNFYTFFRQNIAPKMKEVENKRLIYFSMYSVCALIGLISLGCCITIVIRPDMLTDTACIFALASVGIYVICNSIKKAYKKSVKAQITNRVLSYLGDFHLNIFAENYSSDAIYKNLMIRQFTEIPQIDDVITGTYKGIPVEIIEAEMKSESAVPEKGNKFSKYAFFEFSKKTIISIAKIIAVAILFRNVRNVNKLFKEKQTVFKGLLFSFEYKRNIPTTVITRNREYLHPLNVGEDINLEDLEYNRIYQTSGYNQVEARILLQPAFMERLKALHHKGLKVACCFQGHKIFIAIKTDKDMFELPFFRSTKNINCYKEIINQIEDILSIIDTLKLAK